MVDGSISSFSADAMSLPLWPVATNRESQGDAKHKAAKLSANGAREQSSGSNSSMASASSNGSREQSSGSREGSIGSIYLVQMVQEL